MKKTWDEMTKLEKAIANAEYTLEAYRKGIDTLEDVGNIVARMAMESEYKKQLEYVTDLKSGRYDAFYNDMEKSKFEIIKK